MSISGSLAVFISYLLTVSVKLLCRAFLLENEARSTTTSRAEWKWIVQSMTPFTFLYLSFEVLLMKKKSRHIISKHV